jgi:hypothetical protein
MNQNNEKLFAAIIDEIAHLAKQRFNARKFIVVGYPENSFLFKNWTRHIKNPIVQTVDYSNIYLTSILKENDIIWGEGHPSALANQFFTDLLVEDLKKLGIVQ